jgi:hypothetical protein
MQAGQVDLLGVRSWLRMLSGSSSHKMPGAVQCIWSACRSACSVFWRFGTVFHVRVACYFGTCQQSVLDVAGGSDLNTAWWNSLQEWMLARQVQLLVI